VSCRGVLLQVIEPTKSGQFASISKQFGMMFLQIHRHLEINPLVNIQKVWKITMFNGKTHEINGHFQ